MSQFIVLAMPFFAAIACIHRFPSAVVTETGFVAYPSGRGCHIAAEGFCLMN